jgi:hypothetical protein
MPVLTRKRVNDQPLTWHVHYAGVRVGVITERSGVAFEAAWRDYLPKRSDADFEEWRQDATWHAAKYARWDRNRISSASGQA